MSKKYILVSSSDPVKFAQEINRYIRQGYELYGSPMTTTVCSGSVMDGNEFYALFAQALVVEDRAEGAI